MNRLTLINKTSGSDLTPLTSCLIGLKAIFPRVLHDRLLVFTALCLAITFLSPPAMARRINLKFYLADPDQGVSIPATEFSEDRDKEMLAKPSWMVSTDAIKKKEKEIGYLDNGFRLAKANETSLGSYIGDNEPTYRCDCGGLVFVKAGLIEPCSIYGKDAAKIITNKNFGFQLHKTLLGKWGGVRAREGDVVVCLNDAGEVEHVAYVIEVPFLSGLPFVGTSPIVITKDGSERVYIGPADKLTSLNHKNWKQIQYWRVNWNKLKVKVTAGGEITIADAGVAPQEIKPGERATLSLEYTVSDAPARGIDVKEEVELSGPGFENSVVMGKTQSLTTTRAAELSGESDYAKGKISYAYPMPKGGNYIWKITLSAPEYNSVTREVKFTVKSPETTDRWSGEWVDGAYHMSISGSAEAWSGTFQADFKDGDPKHKDTNGKISGVQCSGNEASGNWESDYSDSVKQGKRRGTFKIRLVPGKTPAEDRVTGEWLEQGDALVQQQPDTAMKPGTKWPVNWRRIK